MKAPKFIHAPSNGGGGLDDQQINPMWIIEQAMDTAITTLRNEDRDEETNITMAYKPKLNMPKPPNPVNSLDDSERSLIAAGLELLRGENALGLDEQFARSIRGGVSMFTAPGDDARFMKEYEAKEAMLAGIAALLHRLQQ